MTSDNALRDAVRQYLQLGWHVVPLHSVDTTGGCTCGKGDCKSPGKHPRTRNGLKAATTSINTVNNWWRKWPDANIGVVTGKVSGLVVVDVDPDKGGMESSIQLSAGKDHDTLSQVTGSGGWHRIYQYPDNVDKIANSASKLGKGLDIRADGGYIVVPPSNHLSGKRYTWDGKQPSKETIRQLPDDLLELCLKPKQVNQKTKQLNPQARKLLSLPDGDSIYEGSRNVTLAEIAGKIRRSGKRDSEVRKMLHEANELRCKPPLDSEEVDKIARSICMYLYKPKLPLYEWRDFILSEVGPKQPTTRYVLQVLAKSMKPNDERCYPSIKQIARDSSLSEKTVKTHLKIAKDEGWLYIIKTKSGNQQYENNTYKARIPDEIANKIDNCL